MSDMFHSYLSSVDIYIECQTNIKYHDVRFV